MKLSLLCVVFIALLSIAYCRGLTSEEEDRPSLVESVKRYLIKNTTAKTALGINTGGEEAQLCNEALRQLCSAFRSGLS